MADKTNIEWTDATWNPVLGCSVISPGCTNCYAMRLAGTRLKHTPSRAGLTTDSKAGPVWNGAVRFMPNWLTQPLHWMAPRDIFVAAHGDLFHANVDQHWQDQIFAVMALAEWHRFQVLTKRADRMLEYLSDPETPGRVLRCSINLLAAQGVTRRWTHKWVWPLPHVMAGISAESQPHFNERIEPLSLLSLLRWRTWLSAEPLLGLLDLANGIGVLDWVVAGGESGPNARPMHPDWARDIRDQCVAAKVAFFFKQWGEWAPGENCGGPMRRSENTAEWFDGEWHFGRMTPSESANGHYDDEPGLYRVGKKAAGALLDGQAWRQMPERADAA